MSASSWGCELKYGKKDKMDGLRLVSLLVRLWVEISQFRKNLMTVNVSLLVRLWVEILRKSYTWQRLYVSLLVRLWVEMLEHLVYRWGGLQSASSWGCELKCTWVRIPVWGQASCEVAYSTRYNKDSPTSIGGEMNCKQENERQWRAERNRYPPLTWGKSQSACCWHVRLCEITDCELKQILL